MGCSRHYEAFCSATVETFSITFPAGESGPHDTLMHYLSFANSISAVSHSCLQSQQPTRRSLVIHTVWFMYTPVSLQKMSCCSPLPSRHNMAAAICLYLSPHLPSQTLLPFSSSLPNGAFWLPQFHIGPFLRSKWNIYIYTQTMILHHLRLFLMFSSVHIIGLSYNLKNIPQICSLNMALALRCSFNMCVKQTSWISSDCLTPFCGSLLIGREASSGWRKLPPLLCRQCACVGVALFLLRSDPALKTGHLTPGATSMD